MNKILDLIQELDNKQLRQLKYEIDMQIINNAYDYPEDNFSKIDVKLDSMNDKLDNYLKARA
jgi:hypothetical protein